MDHVESIRFEERNLAQIRESYDYKCPFCGNPTPDDGYTVDGKEYPKVFNEREIEVDDMKAICWEEVHMCMNCNRLYRFTNGC